MGGVEIYFPKKTLTLFSFLFCAAFLFFGLASTANAALVQSDTGGGTGGSSSNSQAFTTGVTSGNTMVFFVMNNTNTTATISSIGWTGGSCGTITATPAGMVSQGTAGSMWAYYANITSSGCTGVSVSFSSSINSIVIFAEYSGMATSNVLDCEATGTSASATSFTTSGTCNTTNATDTLVGGALVTSAGGGTLTKGAPYTQRVNNGSKRLLEDQDVIATGAQVATASYSSNQSYIMWLLALKKAASSAVDIPTFDNGTATYNNDVTVNLSDTTSGATICYTLDGTTPAATTPGTCSTGSTYSTPLTINSNGTVVKVIGTKATMTNSSVATATYTLTVATPTATPGAGVLLTNTPVSLATTTAGSSILYAIGSTPSCPSTGTTYLSPITVGVNETIQAISCKTNYNASSVLSAVYTVRAGQSFYVSNAGSDSNSGTDSSHTWAHAPGMTGCTANCASQTLVGDDIVYLKTGDSWTSTTLTIGYSGLSGHQITLTSYGTGNKPIVSASANNPAITVTAANRGYWTIDGLDLRATGAVSGITSSLAVYFNYWPSEMGQVPGWIIQNNNFNAEILVSGPNINIKNNVFNGTGNSNDKFGAISVRGPETTGDIVEGNTVSNWIDRGIWVMGSGSGAPGVTVRNNTVHDIVGGSDNEGMGINIDGFASPVSGSKVYGNTVYTCAGIGITHENAFGAETYNNLVHDCTIGGIDAINYSTHRSEANNSSIHNNIIYNTNIGIPIYDTNSWSFLNNTIYQGTGSPSSAFKVVTASTYISNLTFTNNIIAGTWDYPINVPDNKSIWTQLDYNDIIPSGTTVLLQLVGGSKTLANLQSLGLMTNGTTTNPSFVSTVTPDFHLQFGSPSIDTGTNVSLTSDYVGTSIPQGLTPDIGAYEYIQSTPPTVSVNNPVTTPVTPPPSSGHRQDISNLLALSTSTAIINTQYVFSQNLSLGQSHSDVKSLQQFLNTHGFILTTAVGSAGSLGNETEKFGSLTYKALKAFQKSVGLPSTGWFGPMTRGVIAGMR